MRLRGQFAAAGHPPGESAQQDGDEILLLLDAPFEVGNRPGCRVHELLRLPDVDHRGRAPLLTDAREIERLVARGQRPPGDVELQIERAERKVSVRYTADE